MTSVSKWAAGYLAEASYIDVVIYEINPGGGSKELMLIDLSACENVS